MFPVKKELANGKIKFFIRYRNEQGKLVYYPKVKYPDFFTKYDAYEWIKNNRDKFTDIKKQADIHRKIQTKHKYPDFDLLIEKFLSAQKSDAPNSWQSSMLYLHRFVLDFYLLQKSVYDVNEWYLYFEEFRDFLEKRATVEGKHKIIDYSTMNHCIRTLNKFLSVMQRSHVLKSSSPLKCRPFPKDKLNTRGYKDIFKPDEYLSLKNSLVKSKEFFIILFNSGMRFNELYSLSIDDIREVDDLPDHLKERFTSYKVEVFGFISLESQIDGKVRSEARFKAKKNGDYLFERKPLKSCKKIDSKNRRIIPIFDKETWDIIIKNYDRGCLEFESSKFGTNPKDYFLLDVDPSVLRREFIQHTKKGFHSCRHTYITTLVGRFNDMTLTRLISGHRSEAFEAYVHIYQQYAEETSRKHKFTPKKFKEVA